MNRIYKTRRVNFGTIAFFAIAASASASLTSSNTGTTIAFGDQALTTASAGQTVTLTASGTTGNGYSIATNTGNTGDFTLAYSGGCTSASGTLTTNGTCTISVRFAPTALGPRAANVLIKDGTSVSAATLFTIPLTGNGTAALTLSPAALTFGQQYTGTTSAAQPVTVTNTSGSNITLTATPVTRTGLNTGDFATSFPATGGCAANLVLAAGNTCTVNVTFTPPVGAGVSRAATLSVNYGTGGTPPSVTAALTGLATPSSILATPTSLAFPSTFTGGGSSTLATTVAVAGASTITGITFGTPGNNNDFSVSNNSCALPAALSASGTTTCVVTVKFTPTAAGVRSRTMTIAATTGNITVALSGTGAASNISATPNPVPDFGIVAVGNSSAVQTVTVTAAGNATFASGASIALGGTNADNFGLSNNTCPTTTATPIATCSVNVKFTPTGAAGNRSATLVFTANTNTITLKLGGTAVLPGISMTPSPLPFGSLLLGVPATLTTAINAALVGTNTLTVTALSLSGGNGGTDYTISSNTCTLPAILSNGGKCVVSITFKPSATGNRTRALNVTANFNDPTNTNASATVNLSGTGVGTPNIKVSPGSLSFGNTGVGNTLTQSVTLKNIGNAPATFGTGAPPKYTITGANATEFVSVASSCGATLGINATCLIPVSFTPAQMGARSATLTINEIASGATPSGNTPQTVSLSGNGVAVGEYWLRTGVFTKTDAATGLSVKMWGYCDRGSASGTCGDAGNPYTSPGPRLSAQAGAALRVHLQNTLPEPTSIIIPGQPTVVNKVELAPDSAGRKRIRSFVLEAPAGSETAPQSQDYTWNNAKGGTFLYQSGSHPGIQVQMGLYGAMTTAAPYGLGGQDHEMTLVFSEVDPCIHDAVAGTADMLHGPVYGTKNATDKPASCFQNPIIDQNGLPQPDQLLPPSSPIYYTPTYFSVTTYPDASTPLTGPVLLRMLNAGNKTHVPELPTGGYVQLVAEDGNPLPFREKQYSVFLPAGKTMDALWNPPAGAVYPLFDKAGHFGLSTTLNLGTPTVSAPVAVSDIYVTQAGGTLSAPNATAGISSILDNDLLNGTGAMVSMVTGPTNAAVNGFTLNADGSFTYTPSAGFTGSDSFTYTITVGSLTSNVATVSILVQGSLPVATPDTATTTGMTPVLIPVLANDTNGTDGTNAGLTIVAVNQPFDPLDPTQTADPGFGTVLTVGTGLQYTPPSTPADTFAGTANFTYQVKNQAGLISAPGMVTVTLTRIPPQATDDSFNVSGNSPGVYLDILANDLALPATTPPSVFLNPASIVITSSPGNGSTMTVVTDRTSPNFGKVFYKPLVNLIGTDTFTYTVKTCLSSTFQNVKPPTCPKGDVSNIGTISLNVSANGVNAVDISTGVPISPVDTTVTLNLLKGATPSVAGDTLVVNALTPPTPAIGTPILNPDNTLTYTVPGGSMPGTVTMSYQLRDVQSTVLSNIAAINVKIGQAHAYDDTASTSAGNTAGVAIPVVGNDTPFAQGNAMLINSVTQPAAGQGTVVIDPTNTFVTYYPPVPAFTALNTVVTFTYQARDAVTNQLTDNFATVTVTVTKYPVAQNDTAVTGGLQPVTINVLSNDAPSQTGDTVAVVLVAQPPSGVAVVNANNSITYTPASAITSGTQSIAFKYNLNDITTGLNSLSPATVTVTLYPAPVAVGDTIASPVKQGAPQTSISNVLTNDINSLGATGTGAGLKIASVGPLAANLGTVGIDATGTAILYTPPTTIPVTQTVNIPYTALDTFSNSPSNTATVAVTLVGPPQAAPDTATATGTGNQAISVLTNDTKSLPSDAALSVANTLSAVTGSDPNNPTRTDFGTVARSGANTTVTWTPPIAANAFAGPQPITVNFTYQALDGTQNLNSAPATVTITWYPTPTVTSIAPASGTWGSSQTVTLTGTNLLGASAVNVAGTGVTVSSVTPVSATAVTATFAVANGAATGARNVTVVTPGGVSVAQPFTVTALQPTLTQIAPASGIRSFTAHVTLTGTNLYGGKINNPAGITVTGTTVSADGTTMTADFAIDAAANPGSRNIFVTTQGGTTTPNLAFTVLVPVLTSISPSSGAWDTGPTTVTLTGTSLTGATAINVSGTGITVGSLVSVNDTTVTASFSIAHGATAGARTVSVTTPAGATGNQTFTVTQPAPTLTAIAPASGIRGFTTAVTLTGTNLTGATGLTFSPAGGLTVNAFTVVNDTTVTASLVFTGAAAIGPRTITVTTPGGIGGTATFTVLAPALTSILPISAAWDTAPTVTLTGTSLTGATSINVSGTGVTVGALTVTDTSVSATFTIAHGAPAGNRTVTVTTPGGNSNSVTFAVTALAPTLGTISPASGLNGTTVPVTLTGTNLTGATAIAVSGAGVTVNTITVVNDTTVTANFVITSGVATTSRNVTVRTPGGTSGTVAFKVN